MDDIIEGLHKLTNCKTRNRLTEAGFNYVTKYHDLKKIANQVKEIYLQFL